METTKIFNVTINELRNVLKIIHKYEDYDLNEIDLDQWLVVYHTFLKNFYNIDVEETLDNLLCAAAKFLKYKFTQKSKLLGNFEYTLHHKDELRADITFIKLVSKLYEGITEKTEYNIKPLIEKQLFNDEQYFIEQRMDGYEEAKIEVIKLKVDDLSTFEEKIINWLNNEVNVEKGNIFLTRLREDIVSSYLPPIGLRRPTEDIDIVVNPNFNLFSKTFPDDMRKVINIIEHAQITKHPYVVIMTFFDTLKSYFKIDFYKECMYHRQYINQITKEDTFYPLIKQHYSGEYVIYWKGDIHLVDYDVRKIILKWIELAEEKVGLKEVVFTKILNENIYDVFF